MAEKRKPAPKKKSAVKKKPAKQTKAAANVKKTSIKPKRDQRFSYRGPGCIRRWTGGA